VTIVGAALAEMFAHAREEAPNECCGVLIGGTEAILAAVRARNLALSPTRYVLDPEDHFAAQRNARARNLQVVGFYHSHPRSAAFPSDSDIAESAYAEAIYVIVGIRDGAQEAKAFTISRDGGVQERALTVTVGEQSQHVVT
jgi:proteasome lid subunit RPN8/RPN11